MPLPPDEDTLMFKIFRQHAMDKADIIQKKAAEVRSSMSGEEADESKEADEIKEDEEPEEEVSDDYKEVSDEIAAELYLRMLYLKIGKPGLNGFTASK